MATIADVRPDKAKVCVTVMKRIYPKLRTKPMPILSPIPPLTLREDRDIPMIVRMNAAAVMAKRL